MILATPFQLTSLPARPNNGRVLRRVSVLLVCLVFQGAPQLAPFLHAHTDDHATDHHAGVTLHAHVESHDHHSPNPADTGLTASDDSDVLYIDGFTALVNASIEPLVAAVSLRIAPPARVLFGPVGETAPRAHGPPGAAATSLRAPPA